MRNKAACLNEAVLRVSPWVLGSGPRCVNAQFGQNACIYIMPSLFGKKKDKLQVADDFCLDFFLLLDNRVIIISIRFRNLKEFC
jgi:hypothetical protein